MLREIADGVYEGISPAKGNVRRFIKLPDGLDEAEMLEACEAVLGRNTQERGPFAVAAHVNQDITSKNEEIDGGIYMRLRANADVILLTERVQDMRKRIERLRAERKESSGESRK